MCRGHDYERLEAFQQRMLNEFPYAIAMQHVNQPDQTIYQAEAQCILGSSCSLNVFTLVCMFMYAWGTQTYTIRIHVALSSACLSCRR